MTYFWVSALALTTLLYVLLDGFDLGVGILFGLTRNERLRQTMLAAISPVWDGNETWLVLTAAILFGAFPIIYATLLSAFYLPLILMLGALILRGVAFEFRYKATTSRWLWDFGFAGGSLLASFVQGATVGSLVEGLPMRNGHYAGGMWDWFGGFSCLSGLGLCLGYSLLGAGWLVAKDDGELRERGYRLIVPLTVNILCFLAISFIYAEARHFQIMERWFQRPYLVVFPIIGACASLALVAGPRLRKDALPLLMTALIFLSAFGTLAISFWPYMIPFSITIDQAAAPTTSLTFMFWGAGLIVLPITLIYTGAVYRVFSGKVAGSDHYH